MCKLSDSGIPWHLTKVHTNPQYFGSPKEQSISVLNINYMNEGALSTNLHSWNSIHVVMPEPLSQPVESRIQNQSLIILLGRVLQRTITCQLWQLSQHEYIHQYALCLGVISSIRECAMPWEEVTPQVILISTEFTATLIANEVWKKLIIDQQLLIYIALFRCSKLAKTM
jgi:hypothetical protein